MTPRPLHTYTLILPSSWEGSCFELLSAGHTAQLGAPPGPLGLDWGFPAGPRNPVSRHSVACPTLGASRSLTLAWRQQQGDPRRPQVCTRPGEGGVS